MTSSGSMSVLSASEDFDFALDDARHIREIVFSDEKIAASQKREHRTFPRDLGETDVGDIGGSDGERARESDEQREGKNLLLDTVLGLCSALPDGEGRAGVRV